MEEKTTLHTAFIPVSFDDRSTVGKDQVEPIKAKVLDYINSNPTSKITDILVISSSAKLPFYTTIAGKKRIDPESDTKNLKLAQERSNFVSQVLKEVQKTNSTLEKVAVTTKAELAGPDFQGIDLNKRFVTKMTEGYTQQVRQFFAENQKMYEEQAYLKSSDELLDEKKYSSLYQVKYKPFHGFRLSISGRKCSNSSEKSILKPKASKQ